MLSKQRNKTAEELKAASATGSQVKTKGAGSFADLGNSTPSMYQALSMQLKQRRDDKASSAIAVVSQAKNAVREEEAKKQDEKINTQGLTLSQIFGAAYLRDNPVRDYAVELTDGIEATYEAQKYNNCYCMTAATLFNQHARHKNLQGVQPLDQYNVRAYQPEYVPYDEFEQKHRGFQENVYNKERAIVEGYQTKDSYEMGNIYAIADMFLQQDPNVCVHNMLFSLSNVTDRQYRKLTNYFMDQVKSVLDKGEAVGVYKNRHYVTIIGLNNGMVKYLDSNCDTPNIPKADPAEVFFDRTCESIDITWLEDKPSDDELKAEFTNLQEVNGEFSTVREELPKDDYAHTYGISVSKNDADKQREKKKPNESNVGKLDDEVLELVGHQVYIPKKTVVPAPFVVNDTKAEYDQRAAERQRKLQSKEESVAVKSETTKNRTDLYRRADFNGFASIRNHTYVFTSTTDKDRSASFLDLKYTLMNCDDVITALENGHIELSDSLYEKYLKLYQAASQYITSHISALRKDGKQRIEAAYAIKDMLDIAGRSILHKNKDLVPDAPVPEYDMFSSMFVAENIETMTGYFRSYCQQVDKDSIASDEEKIRRKWDAIKNIEHDILIYYDNVDETKLDSEQRFLLDSYRSLRQQIALREMIKGVDKQKSALDNQDDGVTEDQKRGIAEIDSWLVRNIRNGGYMSAFGVVSDRTDIVGKILSMDRRKKLYVYYLVESRERVNPTMEGFTTSQNDYVPNIYKFKDRMIASKLKFYKRFSGSYIYWNKLTEAMSIADAAAPALAVASEYFLEARWAEKEKASKEKEGKGKDEKDKSVESKAAKTAESSKQSETEKTVQGSTDQESQQVEDAKKLSEDYEAQREEHIKDMKAFAGNILRAIALLKENENPKTDAAKKQKNEQELDSLKADARKIGTRLKTVSEQLQEKKAKSMEVEQEFFKEYVGTLSKDVKSVSGIIWNTTDAIFVFDEQNIDNVIANYKATATCLSILSGVVGGVFSCISFYKDIHSMSAIDAITRTTDILGTVTSLTTTTLGAIGAASSTAISAVSAGTDTVKAAVKTAKYIRDSHYRGQAFKLAAKQQTFDKYTEGMLELTKTMDDRQAVSTAGAITTAAISLTALALVVASVATAGTAAIIGGVSFGIGVGFMALDRKFGRNMKLNLFDAFYNVDALVEEAKEDYKKKNYGREMPKEQVKELPMLVRSRLSANMGYYSPYHATKSIAGEYATYLLAKAHDAQNGELYVNIIKGLGLKYRYDKDNADNCRPLKEDIVKKLIS